MAVTARHVNPTPWFSVFQKNVKGLQRNSHLALLQRRTGKFGTASSQVTLIWVANLQTAEGGAKVFFKLDVTESIKFAMKNTGQGRQDVEGQLQVATKENVISFRKNLEHSIEPAAPISTGKLILFFLVLIWERHESKCKNL